MISKSVLFVKQTNSLNKFIQKCYKYTISENIIKRIEFKTCGKLYEELKARNPRLYRKSPTNGLPVSVEYVDTFGDKKVLNNSNVKTIVAIHGMPGNYEHFSGLFDTFGGKESSVRVISPNMPEFSLTRQSMAFWHSNNERSQFIRDFLKAINVSKIDCLISHSAGIHPIAKIWSKPEDLKIVSIGLFCPQPLWVTKLFFRLSRILAYFAENKIGIKLMDVLRPDLIAHRFGYPMRFESVDEVLMLWLFSRLDPNKLHKRLEYLKNHKIPTLVVYGERDKLIQKSNFYDLVRDIGANETDFVRFTDENTPESRPQNDDKILSKVLTFKTGGHFTHNKFSDIVNKHVIKDLLS